MDHNTFSTKYSQLPHCAWVHKGEAQCQRFKCINKHATRHTIADGATHVDMMTIFTHTLLLSLSLSVTVIETSIQYISAAIIKLQLHHRVRDVSIRVGVITKVNGIGLQRDSVCDGGY